jgi:hypothetical protein
MRLLHIVPFSAWNERDFGKGIIPEIDLNNSGALNAKEQL